MEWTEEDGKLMCELTFGSQTQLSRFVLMLAMMSDQMNHHADMVISYNRLFLSLCTHDENAITTKDHEWVQRAAGCWEAISEKEG